MHCCAYLSAWFVIVILFHCCAYVSAWVVIVILFHCCAYLSAETTGGNVEGDKCVFDFNYDGMKYSSCTKENHDVYWCATTNNFDKDGKWAECLC